jgi:hypothetical protein
VLTSRPRLLACLIVLAGSGAQPSRADGPLQEPEKILTAQDLFDHCSSSEAVERQVCFAYIRGFSDGNRWLLRDEPVPRLELAPQGVCVPNAEPAHRAAGAFVSFFRLQPSPLRTLSPFRALSKALAQRYPCE